MSKQEKWLPTDGTVTSAQFTPGGARVPGCWRVAYTYRVGEQTFSAVFKDRTSTPNKYKPGTYVPVDYIAYKPSSSRVPGITTGWRVMGLPLALGAIGVPLLYLIFRMLLSK